MSGQKVGTKRSDRRWQSDDGQLWDSRFEWRVWSVLSEIPTITVRRCERGKGDSFNYVSNVRGAKCLECDSREVVQERTYTPDLLVRRKSEVQHGGGYYLELKGRFPPAKRSLLRAFVKSRPEVDLRLVLEKDGRATPKLDLLEYCHEYLKIPTIVWHGALPDDWL